MKIFQKTIGRPLPIYLAAVLVSLLGIWCLSELPVNRAPEVQIPFSVVYVPYVGASPEEVEAEITVDLDEQLGTLADLRHLTSIASDGVSTHILEFEDRADMKESLRSVRDETSLVESEFPDDADAPIVREISFDDLPIVFFTLHGGGDQYRLREIAEDLAPDLETVAGVSRVDVFGGLEREVWILADPPSLTQHGLTLQDLVAAIGRQSSGRPSGELRGRGSSHLIRTTGEFHSLEEIRSIVVLANGAGSLHLRDVARVEVGHVRRTSGAWLDGEPSVTLIVRRRPDVNTMETVEQLEAMITRVRSSLPPGIQIETHSDASDEIARMIRQLGTSGAIGLVLVVLVLFTVFGVRRALLVGSVLPISVLVTFVGLYLFDMEISNIALFSLILVLGLVVDGAIIVGEAIYAEAEAGATSVEAAKTGIGKVGMPVISADLTTVAAFLPMLLMVGVMGQFMSVMPKVVAFALIGSVFVDHLLLPAVAAQLRPSERTSRTRKFTWSPDFERIRPVYERALMRALRMRVSILATATIAFLGAGTLYITNVIDSIFLPASDQARFIVNYALPLGTPLAETDHVGQLIGEHLREMSEVKHWVLTTGDTGALSSEGRDGARVGPEYGKIDVELVPGSEREFDQSTLVAKLRRQLEVYAGVEIDLQELEGGPPVGAALAIRVKGDSLEQVANAAERIERRLSSLPGATDVRMDYDRTRPEIRVDLDRARASARFGILPEQVSNALLTSFHGVDVGRMWMGDERVDLRLRAPDTTPHTMDQVGELPLRAADGRLVPLGEIARIWLDFGQNAIFRHNGRRTVTVRADAVEGFSTVLLETTAREALAAMTLPGDIALEFGGETEERDRSYASLWQALKWGLLLIYIVIAVQFNSLRQPFIVLLGVPLSVVGVTLGLLITGTPFSFMVFIGIVSLTGIVVNDGIVMVDAINRKRRAGMILNDALRFASSERLRPVLLTTFTTIAGLLPLTLNLTSGGEFWVPLGVTIISGLLLASALTLFVVPVLYSLIESPRANLPAVGPKNRHPSAEVPELAVSAVRHSE